MRFTLEKSAESPFTLTMALGCHAKPEFAADNVTTHRPSAGHCCVTA
jgi:hypothetical protein